MLEERHQKSFTHAIRELNDDELSMVCGGIQQADPIDNPIVVEGKKENGWWMNYGFDSYALFMSSHNAGWSNSSQLAYAAPVSSPGGDPIWIDLTKFAIKQGVVGGIQLNENLQGWLDNAGCIVDTAELIFSDGFSALDGVELSIDCYNAAKYDFQLSQSAYDSIIRSRFINDFFSVVLVPPT